MNPVIFLDLDGPLFSDRVIKYDWDNLKEQYHFNPHISYWKMDSVAVGILNLFYEKNKFEFVISSSWRLLHTKSDLTELFKLNNLIAPITSGDWETKEFQETGCNRANEIGDWIIRNKCDRYIILDDADSGASLGYLISGIGRNEYTKTINEDNIILVNSHIGLDHGNYEKMLEIARAEW
jgi:hypothetical protein